MAKRLTVRWGQTKAHLKGRLYNMLALFKSIIPYKNPDTIVFLCHFFCLHIFGVVQRQRPV
uniref:Uncharacterized protein n=1 Tax=Lotus japonicus TaxID=34305 RepID=I3SXU2_LOTJA|nr:unknown [Lotus japonicus]